MTGILATIKRTVGVSQEDDSFDVEILMFINATIMILSQMGLKEADRTPIIDEATTWKDFLGERTDLEAVKSFIHFKAKLMFDPPTNSAALEAIKSSVDELEWRIANLDSNKGGDVI